MNTDTRTEAQRHYDAQVRKWGEHIVDCHRCKMAIETRGHYAKLCDVGAVCEDEVSIAARRLVHGWPQDREAA